MQLIYLLFNFKIICFLDRIEANLIAIDCMIYSK